MWASAPGVCPPSPNVPILTKRSPQTPARPKGSAQINSRQSPPRTQVQTYLLIFEYFDAFMGEERGTV